MAIRFKKATAHAQSITANLGGTDVLTPLKGILNEPLDVNYPRQVFLLTDGAVMDPEGTVQYVKENLGASTRIFTLGIGQGVSADLVKGVAQMGRGTAEFVKQVRVLSVVWGSAAVLSGGRASALSRPWRSSSRRRCSPSSRASPSTGAQRRCALSCRLFLALIVLTRTALQLAAAYAGIKQVIPPVFDGERLLFFAFLDAAQLSGRCVYVASSSCSWLC